MTWLRVNISETSCLINYHVLVSLVLMVCASTSYALIKNNKGKLYLLNVFISKLSINFKKNSIASATGKMSNFY